MRTLYWLLLLISCNLFAQNSDDLNIIGNRFKEEILSTVPSDQVSTWRMEDIEKWSRTMKADGSFPDFNYQATTDYAWAPAHHMGVAYTWALAIKTPGHPYYQNKELWQKMLTTMRYATSRQWEHINWWHKEIGLPLTCYKLLFLIGDELPEFDRNWLMNATRKGHILDHPSNWPATGQNAVWYAETTMALGVLLKQAQWLNDARNAVATELELNKRQGIQVDQTFYQHGKVFMNGSYGLGFSLDMARFFKRLSDTRFSFSPEQYKIFSNYLLDGQLWLIHGKIMDPSCKGREYCRKNSANSNRFLPACVTMTRVKGPRQKEFEQCVKDLTPQTYEGKFGNKMFYRADFMAHNRKNFAFSIKMHSERTLSGDTSPLGEGLKSHNQSDGVTYIFRDGSEYFDIVPIWDFHRWPGITIDYKKEYDPVPDFNYWPARGLSDFVGGVSDGTYGLATYDFKHRLLVAKKSWFLHDKVMVALGSGISGFDWQNTMTSINQEWSQGDMIYSHDRAEDMKLADGKAAINEGSWAYANGVGYHLIRGEKFHLQNTTQEGTWRSVARQLSDELIKGKVTSLWIEHGKGPESDSYAYAVYPAMELSEFKDHYFKPTFKILSNTAQTQAVKFDDGLWQLVFHEKGELDLEDGIILKVDKSIALMVRKVKSQLVLHVASPDQKVATVKISVKRKNGKESHKNVVLPVESRAGDTVKQVMAY